MNPLEDIYPRTKIFLKILLLLGMLGTFFYYVPIRKIYQSVQSVDRKLFWGSVLISFPALYFVALQLWFLTRKQGLKFYIYQVYKINLVVKFYSFFSPASIIGSGLKWYKLASPGKEAEALSAIALSRFWSIFMAIFWGLMWMVLGSESEILSPLLLVLFLVILILGWLFVIRFSPVLGTWAKEKENHARRKTFRFLFSSLGKFFDTIIVYKQFGVKEFLFLSTTGFLKEITALFGQTLLVRSLNIKISFVDLGWMRSIFFLSSLAPFTLVGGVGLREVSMVFVMSSYGIATELAVAYSFLAYTRSVLLYFTGGIIELFSVFSKRVKR